ncbi:MAG: hypothetical protein M3071_00035 [Actinomycetota bacterium]|nr:hypothetical protein [Actinomycetota bacterium]
MSQTPSRAGNQQGARDYELRVQGHLDARWAARLEAASLVNELGGTTTLLVRVLDQAALHGLLQKIRDLGLPLVSVTPAEPDRADHAPIDPQ